MEAARAVRAEAERRNLSPSGVMAAVVEGWARARAGAPPSRRFTLCRAPGCERAVYARGLCRPHEVQERQGHRLRPIQERIQDQVRMGSLRLPLAMLEGLRRESTSSGDTVTELLRRVLAEALNDVPALARAESLRRGGGVGRLGMLRLPAGLAERLSVVAQELGLPVAEVVRRAVVRRRMRE